jgi:hypothetical protein
VSTAALIAADLLGCSTFAAAWGIRILAHTITGLPVAEPHRQPKPATPSGPLCASPRCRQPARNLVATTSGQLPALLCDQHAAGQS